MRAQNVSRRKLAFDACVSRVAHSLGQRPLGTGVVLCLHCTERSDDISRVLETGGREQLIRQATFGDAGQVVDLPHGFVYLLNAGCR
jgi:hypothetical protein